MDQSLFGKDRLCDDRMTKSDQMHECIMTTMVNDAEQKSPSKVIVSKIEALDIEGNQTCPSIGDIQFSPDGAILAASIPQLVDQLVSNIGI